MGVKGLLVGMLLVGCLSGFAKTAIAQTPQLISIKVTSEFPTINVGQSETFIATGYYQYGSPFPLSDPQWSGDGQHGTMAWDNDYLLKVLAA